MATDGHPRSEGVGHDIVLRDERPATQGTDIATVVEMIDSTDYLTGAGQRHMMGKIARIIKSAIDDLDLWKRRPLILRVLANLRHEAERPAPHVRAFKKRAGALLSLMARERDSFSV